MKKSKRSLSSILLAGLLLGGISTMGAMAISSHHTNAAVAVIDEKNIEEAIKTAIQTANILTNEEKQLALMMLNAKKLDAEKILKYEYEHASQQTQVLNEKGMYQGLNNTNTAIDNAWRARLGDLESVLNGNITAATAYNNEVKREKVLAETYKDAAVSAKNVQQMNETLAENTMLAAQNSASAESSDQVLQYGNQIKANGVLGMLHFTRVYSNAVQAEVAHYQAENLRRAQMEARDADARKKAGEATYSAPGRMKSPISGE